MLTGAQMKALASAQQAAAENCYKDTIDYLLGIRPGALLPYNTAEERARADAIMARMHQANARAGIGPYGDGLRNAYVPPKREPEPEPEPKGPETWWHWMAHLEDTGQLRWWHWGMAIVELAREKLLDAGNANR